METPSRSNLSKDSAQRRPASCALGDGALGAGRGLRAKSRRFLPSPTSRAFLSLQTGCPREESPFVAVTWTHSSDGRESLIHFKLPAKGTELALEEGGGQRGREGQKQLAPPGGRERNVTSGKEERGRASDPRATS